MDEMEAIRQRRLRELQEQGNQEQAQASQEQAVEQALIQLLSAEARERLTRVRMSRPDLAEMVTAQIFQAARQGNVPRRLEDADLRKLLQKLTPKDRDIKITRR